MTTLRSLVIAGTAAFVLTAYAQTPGAPGAADHAAHHPAGTAASASAPADRMAMMDLEKMQTAQAKAIYRLRGAVAEFPNAWIKAKLRLRQFHVRGKAKALSECLWACITYNIQQWIRLRWRARVGAAAA